MKFLLAFLFLYNFNFIVLSQVNDFSKNQYENYCKLAGQGILIPNININFEKEIVKGDTIMGFNRDLCAVSFNKGKDWEIIELKNQTYDGNNGNYSRLYIPESGDFFDKKYNEGNIYIKKNDLIIFIHGKFFISNDWKKFRRVSSRNTSLNIKEGETDGVNFIYSDKGYLHNQKFVIIQNGFLYESTDCNKWKKSKLPIDANMFSSYDGKMYISNGFDFFQSIDNGNTWDKLIINYPFDFKKFDYWNQTDINEYNRMKNMSEYYKAHDFFIFNNNLHVQCSMSSRGQCHIIYNLKNNESITLNKFEHRFLFNDSLFFLTESGKFHCYNDFLFELDFNIREVNYNKFHRFSIDEKIIVLDGKLSIQR